MKYSRLILAAACVWLSWGCASTLRKSAADGDLAEVNELIAEGKDVNARDDRGWTPIYYAIRSDHPGVVESLIAAGADLKGRDVHGQTPLSLAAVYSDPGTAELLVRAGAEVNAEDSLKWTPLHNAAEKGRPGMVSLLIWLGADVNPRNNTGWTPLDLSVWHRHPAVSEILLANGGVGYSYEAMELLLEAKRTRERRSAPPEPASPPEPAAVREEVYDAFNEQTTISLSHSIESLRQIEPWQTVTVGTDGELYPSIRLGLTLESDRYYFFSPLPAQFKIGDEIVEAVRTDSLADMDGTLVVTRGEFLLDEKLAGAIRAASSLMIRVQFDNSPPLTWRVPPGVLEDWKLFFADAERIFGRKPAGPAPGEK